MASTIPLARAALFALLSASPPASLLRPDETVEVGYGEPTHEQMEGIYLLGVGTPDEEWGPMGTVRPTEETYELEVGIKVHNPNLTAAEVDARGWALRDFVRDVVYDNLTLSGTVRVAKNGQSLTNGVQRANKGEPVMFILHHIAIEARVIG